MSDTPKNVAIVGCASAKENAPFWDDNNPQNADWEIWGVNNLFLTWQREKKVVKNKLRWFEIHNLRYDPHRNLWERRSDYRHEDGKFAWSAEFRGQRTNDYVEGLKGLGCPVYMQRSVPELIPNSVEYPLKEVLELFPEGYLTNTISWEMALYALLLKKGEVTNKVGVWGVDMAVGGEYQYQRSSCSWLLGYLKGLGCEVYIPDEADLLKTRHLYAFGEKEMDRWGKKVGSAIKNIDSQINEAQMRIQQLSAELEAQKTKLQQGVGARQAIKEMHRIWQ